MDLIIRFPFKIFIYVKERVYIIKLRSRYRTEVELISYCEYDLLLERPENAAYVLIKVKPGLG